MPLLQENSENQILPSNLQSIISRGRNDIRLFASELLGINLHPGQIKFSQAGGKVKILVPCNRWGKTTYLSVKHIHTCFYKLGVPTGNQKAWLGSEYQTCALAPHSQQAEVVTRTIRQILSSTFPMHLSDDEVVSNKCLIGWFLLKSTESYPMSVTYTNGSSTIVRSTGEDKAASIAAKAFGYIGYDEAGKSYHLEEEYFSVLLPRLADFSGTIDLVGTPDSQSPSFVFYQELFWKGGGDGNPQEPGYYAQEGTAYDNPYLPSNYIQDTLDTYKGDPRLDQVLYGKFISVGNKVFDHKSIIECSKDMPEYLPYEVNHKYIIGIDTAIGNDDLVITVIDWTEKPFKVVRISGKRGNSQSPGLHLQDLMDIFYHYDQGRQCSVILETFNGESLRYYYDLPQDIKVKTKCFGSGRPQGIRKATVDKKEDILIAARKLLDNHEIEFSNKYRTLLQQLANYTQDDAKIKTDYTISFCLACFYATDGQPKNTTLSSTTMTW